MRLNSDLVLPWLRQKPAAALGWEFTYAIGAAVKRKKDKLVVTSGEMEERRDEKIGVGD